MKESSKARSSKKDEAAPASYSEAIAELEQILDGIESGDTDIDLLSEQMKRAVWLVQFCKSRLKSTEAEVRKIIRDIDPGDQDNDAD